MCICEVIITKLIIGVENSICIFWIQNLSVLMKQKEQLEQEQWEQKGQKGMALFMCC